MAGFFRKFLTPPPWLFFSGTAIAGVVLVAGLQEISQKSDSNKKFILNSGPASVSDRLEAYRKLLASGKSLDLNLGDFESHSWVHKQRRRLYSLAKGRVLEVGIGGGRGMSYILKNPRMTEYTGIDIVPESIGICRELVKTADFPVYLEIADFTEIPYPDDYFDTSIGSFCACSAEDPVRYFRELGRVSKGHVLLLEHGLSSWNWMRWLGKVTGMFPNEASGYYFGCEQDRDIDELLKESGLRIVKVQKSLFGHVSLIVATRLR